MKRALRELCSALRAPRRAAFGRPSLERSLVVRREKGLKYEPLPDDPASLEDRRLAAGTLVAGKLRVVRQLGAGGMGAVYEVEHTYTKHRRALKLLHPRYAEQTSTVERFLREASAAGHIQSPHVVETFDAGQLESGEPYLVMELLEGQALDELLAARGRLSVPETVELLRQACEGAQAAHDAGIVHRDLKPENLFIVAGREPFVKLLDFGISKFDASLETGRALTREGSLLGTPYYMAPEQLVQRREATPASDVYALGVIAYECVSGLRPFSAPSLPELSVLVHEGKYTPLDALAPELPPGFVRAVARAMQREPERRFASPRAFADALLQSLSGGDVESADTIADERTEPPPTAASAHSAIPPRPDSIETPRSPRLALYALLGIAGIGLAGVGWWSTRATPQTDAPEVSDSALPSATLTEVAPIASPSPEPDVSADAAIPPVRSQSGTRPAPRPSVSATPRSAEQQLGRDNPY